MCSSLEFIIFFNFVCMYVCVKLFLAGIIPFSFQNTSVQDALCTQERSSGLFSYSLVPSNTLNHNGLLKNLGHWHCYCLLIGCLILRIIRCICKITKSDC